GWTESVTSVNGSTRSPGLPSRGHVIHRLHVKVPTQATQLTLRTHTHTHTHQHNTHTQKHTHTHTQCLCMVRGSAMCRFGTSCRKQAQSAAALPKQLQQRPGMSWPTSGPKLRPILLPSALL